MICNSREREKLSEGRKGDECKREAVKKCRHDFFTCGKHNHGCKNEEELVL